MVQLLSEKQAVALVLHRLMESFTDAVGLRMISLGLGMVNVLNGQVELVGVVLRLATVLRPSVGQDALQPDALLLKERNYPVVEQVGGGDGRLLGVELGRSHPTVSVNGW